MKHYLIHFQNGLFAVASGESMTLLPNEFAVISYKNTTAGEPVAQFAREAVVGYQEVSPEDAAKYRLFWAELQLERAAAGGGDDAGLRCPVCRETVHNPDYWFGGMCLRCADELAEQQKQEGEGE